MMVLCKSQPGRDRRTWRPYKQTSGLLSVTHCQQQALHTTCFNCDTPADASPNSAQRWARWCRQAESSAWRPAPSAWSPPRRTPGLPLLRSGTSCRCKTRSIGGSSTAVWGVLEVWHSEYICVLVQLSTAQLTQAKVGCSWRGPVSRRRTFPRHAAVRRGSGRSSFRCRCRRCPAVRRPPPASLSPTRSTTLQRARCDTSLPCIKMHQSTDNSAAVIKLNAWCSPLTMAWAVMHHAHMDKIPVYNGTHLAVGGRGSRWCWGAAQARRMALRPCGVSHPRGAREAAETPLVLMLQCLRRGGCRFGAAALPAVCCRLHLSVALLGCL